MYLSYIIRVVPYGLMNYKLAILKYFTGIKCISIGNNIMCR